MIEKRPMKMHVVVKAALRCLSLSDTDNVLRTSDRWGRGGSGIWLYGYYSRGRSGTESGGQNSPVGSKGKAPVGSLGSETKCARILRSANYTTVVYFERKQSNSVNLAL